MYDLCMPKKNIVKEFKENTFYHLYNRGVAKLPIFLDEEDYKTFLGYLKIYLTSLQGLTLKVAPSRKLKNFTEQVDLLSYCLIPNHFHLLVFQKNPNDISYFMKSLGVKYSMYFNRKYKRVGTIFQGAYKAVEVISENQLLYLSKYIHRNPTGFDPVGWKEYKYSSYGNYLGLFKQVWVKTDLILSYFSKTNLNNSYKSFVEEIDERDLPTIKSVLLEEL